MNSEKELVEGVAAVIEREGLLLVIRRAAGVASPGAWCFPGGAIEPGESQAEALVREVREEVNLTVEPVEKLWTWAHPNGGLVLSWWSAKLLSDSPKLVPDPAEVAEVRWLRPLEIRHLTPLLESNHQFLNQCYPV